MYLYFLHLFLFVKFYIYFHFQTTEIFTSIFLSQTLNLGHLIIPTTYVRFIRNCQDPTTIDVGTIDDRYIDQLPPPPLDCLVLHYLS